VAGAPSFPGSAWDSKTSNGLLSAAVEIEAAGVRSVDFEQGRRLVTFRYSGSVRRRRWMSRSARLGGLVMGAEATKLAVQRCPTRGFESRRRPLSRRPRQWIVAS